MLSSIGKVLARILELHALVATVPLMLVASRAPAAMPVTQRKPPTPKSASDHWHRISELVEDGIDSARRTAALHADALTQIDAAEFALSRLIADLSVVMPMPAAGSRNQAPMALKGHLALAA